MGHRVNRLLVAVMWLMLMAAASPYWAGCGDDDQQNGSNGSPTPGTTATVTPGGPTPTPTVGACQGLGAACSAELLCCEGLTCAGAVCLGPPG